MAASKEAPKKQSELNINAPELLKAISQLPTKVEELKSEGTKTNCEGENGDKPADAAEAAKDTPPKPQEPKGSIGIVKHIYQSKADSDGNATWSDTIPEYASQAAAENEETMKYAVVVRNKVSYDSLKAIEIHSLVIQSPELKSALTEVFKDYPGVSCKVDRLVFQAPFKPFVHRWEGLVKFMKKENDARTKEHLELLHSILKDELKHTIKAFEDFVVHGVISYEHLWTIYQPGSIVFFSYFNETTAGELQLGDYTETWSGGKVYRLSCKVIHWGSKSFGKRRENVDIPAFAGTVGIESLSAFPLEFSKSKYSLKADLVRRGKKFESLAGFHYRR
jgi:hypothetical protein